MINTLVAKVFGTRNEREMKRLQPVVDQINALEAQMRAATDDDLRAKTDEFRAKVAERLGQIKDDANGDPDRTKALNTERDIALKEVLQEILPEAFAVVREAGRRTLRFPCT